MGLKITPIVFAPNTLIKSADMNSNFSAISSATNFDGTWQSTNTVVGLVADDSSINSTNVISIHPPSSGLDRNIAIGSLSAGSPVSCIYVASDGFLHVASRIKNDSCGFYHAAMFFNQTTTTTSVTTFNHGFPGTPTYAIIIPVGDENVSSGQPTLENASIGSIGSTTITFYMSNNSTLSGAAQFVNFMLSNGF